MWLMKDKSQPSVVVGLFAHWLYTNDVPHGAAEWMQVAEIDTLEDFANARYMACFKSYVFGDRFLSAGFCHAVTRYFDDLIQGNRSRYNLQAALQQASPLPTLPRTK
jgi:hypothetical protein